MTARVLPVSVLAALLSLLLLAGCAQQPVNPVDDWQRYRERLAGLEDWQFHGKLGLRYENDSDSASVIWTNKPRHYAIRLSGPLGQGTTWIRGNRDQVRLEQVGEEPITAPTPEDLVYQTLGWEIPVSDLRYWVRGIPSPRSPTDRVERSEQGLLMALEQSGWTIQYEDYHGVGHWSLPGRITARRGDLQLRLVRITWELPDNQGA